MRQKTTPVDQRPVCLHGDDEDLFYRMADIDMVHKLRLPLAQVLLHSREDVVYILKLFVSYAVCVCVVFKLFCYGCVLMVFFVGLDCWGGGRCHCLGGLAELRSHLAAFYRKIRNQDLL
ncbi:hypothetical protein ARMGADRAFT_1019494 [Armillaria gallica]|uniref:Uncharacterized protein n=1 Tax=Armillaria gallica TaxID=47427 RepID=A0A2H3D3J8_ARMGA|nr:hypothetical protein ARMGADRAFT_1019494 [Armillaria gallica]